MRSGLVVALVSCLSACMAYQPVADMQGMSPAASVEAAFATPRDIQAADGATVHLLRAVTSVRGRLNETRGDTLVLGFMSAESAAFSEAPRDSRVAVVLDDRTLVSRRKFSAQRTAALVGAFAVLTLIQGGVSGDGGVIDLGGFLGLR